MSTIIIKITNLYLKAAELRNNAAEMLQTIEYHNEIIKKCNIQIQETNIIIQSLGPLKKEINSESGKLEKSSREKQSSIEMIDHLIKSIKNKLEEAALLEEAAMRLKNSNTDSKSTFDFGKFQLELSQKMIES